MCREPRPRKSTRGNRAEPALTELNERLGVPEDALGERTLATAVELGAEAAKARWVQEGRLVGSKELGIAWGRTRQALGRACDRGELVSLKIGRKRWYPAAFATLDPEQVKAVCLPLVDVDPVGQFIFWQRKHGVLGGCTIAEVLRHGQLQAALDAAKAFARELVGPSGGGRSGAAERGRAARLAWARDGTLVCAQYFAARRGLSVGELLALVARGELFSVTVEHVSLYPAELLKLSHTDAVALCSALDGEDDATKLVFLMREHGALAGRTVAESVAIGRLQQVLDLARAWARRQALF